MPAVSLSKICTSIKFGANRDPHFNHLPTYVVFRIWGHSWGQLDSCESFSIFIYTLNLHSTLWIDSDSFFPVLNTNLLIVLAVTFLGGDYLKWRFVTSYISSLLFCTYKWASSTFGVYFVRGSTFEKPVLYLYQRAIQCFLKHPFGTFGYSSNIQETKWFSIFLCIRRISLHLNFNLTTR